MTGFDDGKADGALRTIGEVSTALGIKPHVLRYWEAQFPLLRPLKRSGGRRYYRPEDVALVEAIDRLINQEGYTLKGAEAVLRAGAGAGAGAEGADRRSADRRSADRRADTQPALAEPGTGLGPGVRLVVSEGPELGEVIEALKALRERLGNALSD